MNPLPATEKLKRVAERVVWFKPPAQALADPIHFLASVMTYGTLDDVRAVKSEVAPALWREALERAPAGIFDARSWAYWNLRLGRDPETPLPARRFD